MKLVTCWQRRRKVGHLVGHALDRKLGGGSGQAAGRARRQRHIAKSRCGVDFLVVLGSEARRRGSYGAASDVDASFGGWSRARARAVGQGLVRRAALLLPQLVASKVEQRAVGGACQPRVKLEYKPTVPTYTQFQFTRPEHTPGTTPRSVGRASVSGIGGPAVEIACVCYAVCQK